LLSTLMLYYSSVDIKRDHKSKNVCQKSLSTLKFSTLTGPPFISRSFFGHLKEVV
jgi:hypothetical protein